MVAAVGRNELRARAVAFSARFADARSEQAERQTFWNDFFKIFDIDRRQVAAFEQIAKRASTGNTGWVDLLYPGQMAVEHKSAAEDLDSAMGQLLDYLPSLTPAQHPWLLVTCDFQNFTWHNLDTDEKNSFRLAELADNLDLFAWMAGYQQPHREFDNDEDANLEATALLQVVHDRLAANRYGGHSLRVWLTRILFCMFAEDTGVWDRAAFHAYLAAHTRPDGSDLGSALAYVFQILNTPHEQRPPALDEELAQLTYINGDLFAEVLPIPTCDTDIREALLAACRFDWAAISPAIFGSLFQNVMTDDERREIGAHYTTEDNILRTLDPLFLDRLRHELDAATTKPRLAAFLDRLANMTFFDPACGCGNFLVIAYRELRALETEALRRLRRLRGQGGQLGVDLTLECRVRVDQFYGIEIAEFPAQIARTALYLADHLANRAVSAEFGQHFARFPIPASPHIVHDNALRISWGDVLPAERCSYLFGNPPFVGMAWMNAEQQDDKRHVFTTTAVNAARSGRLDYVACWYAKAVDYASTTALVTHPGEEAQAAREPIRMAFVSTNSISQGEQARTLGPMLTAANFRIDFAHRTFEWRSEARGVAHVHVVIIGFSRASSDGQRCLFDYPSLRGAPTVRAADNINIYLVDAPDVVPGKRYEPLYPGLSNATKGSQPTDGGHLLVGPEEIDEVRADPIAAKYLRRFIQTKEMLYDRPRWCLWLVDAPPADLRASALLRRRLEHVRAERRQSRTESVQQQATTPGLFTQIRQPDARYLAMPEVSSGARRYIPAAFYEPDVIAGNKIITFPAADSWLFGVLQSAMFTTWVSTVVGRLKSDFSISPSLAYYTFPMPDPAANSRVRIETAAEAVLAARGAHPAASLADLYDPLTMPANLVAAHQGLDRAVDAALAGRKRVHSEADRQAVLFSRYLELTSGRALASTGRQRARRQPRVGADPTG